MKKKLFMLELKENMSFRNYFLHLMTLLVFTACSMGVEDKNADLSNKEKKELKIKNDNSLTVKSVKIIGEDEEREDNTVTSAVVAKYYTIEVCFQDKNIKNGVGNRSVTIDGEASSTDINGCLNWSHDIKVDHTNPNRCKVYSKNITIGGKKAKTVKYSLDYYKNKVTDLEKSRGCINSNVSKEKFNKIEPFEFDNIQLGFGERLAKDRSDAKYVTHAASVGGCLFIPRSDEKLKKTKLRLRIINQETGEVSVGDPQGDQVINTDRKGCFKTGYFSQFEQYKHSHWMPIDLEFEVLTGSLKGKKYTKRVYTNPWEGTNRLIYGKFYEDDLPMTTDVKQKYARLYMDGVMYIQIGNNNQKLEVNDYLGLTISKTYQVVLNPYVDLGHRYTYKKPVKERLMANGRFKLSLVLLAPKSGEMGIDKTNFKNYEYITGVEAEVTVENGVINKVLNIPFKVKDLPRLVVKTMSIFKLEPINDNGIQASVVTGFFKARIPWIKTNVLQDAGLNVNKRVTDVWSELEKQHGKDFKMNEVDSSCSKIKETEINECLMAMREIHEADVTQETMEYRKFVDSMLARLSDQTAKSGRDFQMKISPKKIYTNHLKKKTPEIKITNTRDLEADYDIRISKNDFDELFPYNRTYHHMTQNMAEELCRYSFHRDGAFKKVLGIFYIKKSYDDCLKNPYKYFGVKSVRHVVRLHGIDKDKSYTTSMPIYIGENDSVNKGENKSKTESETLSYGTDIGGKLGVPFTKDFLNIGFKAGYSKSFSTSKSRFSGYSKNESFGSSKGISVEKFVNVINADFERCFEVTSKDYIDSKKVADAEMIRTSSYVGMIGGVNAAAVQEELPDYDNDPKFKSNLGINFYICDDETVNEDFVEAWYFVQSNVESNFGIDGDNAMERVILKAFRGTLNYYELKQALKDLSYDALYTDNIGYMTPEDKLISSWGHLVGDGISKDDSAKFLLEHVEGSFPGTIEGHGTVEKDQTHP